MLLDNLELDEEIKKVRKKYKSDRIDISFGELVNLYKEDELIIRPEYQRYYRWKDEQKTAFIESLIIGIPIPPIFVFEKSDGKWELIDGLQRVTTIISFLGELKKENLIELTHNETKIINKWQLIKTDFISSWENTSYKDLEPKYQRNLKRATCRVEILKSENEESENIKYELFKRLNSGGSKLTPQEIRNAIYRSDNGFNKLLEKILTNKKFKKLVNFTEKEKSEFYDQEVILRVFAYSQYTSENIKNKMELHLDNFMKEISNKDRNTIEKYEKDIITTIDLLDKLEIKNLFQRKTKRNVPVIS